MGRGFWLKLFIVPLPCLLCPQPLKWYEKSFIFISYRNHLCCFHARAWEVQFHQDQPNKTSFTHSGAVVQFISAQCIFCSIKTNQPKKKEQKPSCVDFSRTGIGEPGNEVLHRQTSLSPASHTSSQICAHTRRSNISVPYCFVKLRVTVVALGGIMRSAQRSLSCECE